MLNRPSITLRYLQCETRKLKGPPPPPRLFSDRPFSSLYSGTNGVKHSWSFHKTCIYLKLFLRPAVVVQKVKSEYILTLNLVKLLEEKDHMCIGKLKPPQRMSTAHFYHLLQCQIEMIMYTCRTELEIKRAPFTQRAHFQGRAKDFWTCAPSMHTLIITFIQFFFIIAMY